MMESVVSRTFTLTSISQNVLGHMEASCRGKHRLQVMQVSNQGEKKISHDKITELLQSQCW